MPLRAILDNSDLFAFEQTVEFWEALKNSPKGKQLAMPCCGERAIAKTSPLGNFFFAHYRRAEECDAKPESKEHIFLKGVIAKAAKSANWEVATEYQGFTPNGDQWIADVLCRKETARVALEVQLSKQTLKEFNYRQERYKNSGVRAAWFVSEIVEKSINHQQSKELPIFVVSDYATEEPLPIVKGFNLPLVNFVQLLLSGSVSWKTDPEEFNVYYIKDTCWSCGNSVKQPYGYSVDVYHEFVKTVPNCSAMLKEILDHLSNDKLASVGINRIAAYPNFKGNAPKFPYCAECLHCGQPQANHFLMEKTKVARSEEAEYSELVTIGMCNGRWECEC
jgi:hypothetical protein